MNEAKFVKQTYGAVVATIMETDDSIVEVQERNDGVYGLIVHHKSERCDTWDDLTAYLKPEHFEMLGSVARRMRGEPKAIASVDLLLQAAKTHLMWIDREREGPLYPAGMKRDDPGGEKVWRAWWEDQLDLCAITESQCREALAVAKAGLIGPGVE